MKRQIVAAMGIVVTVAAVLAAGCQRPEPPNTPSSAGQKAAPTVAPPPAELAVTSTAFAAQATIPKKHTGDDANVSPPLAWSGAPAKTKEFALICDDPDAPAGPFTHWAMWGIPAATTKLPENVAKTEIVAALANAKQGQNGAYKVGYFGPAPPPGKPHRYSFTVYALDTTLDVKPGAKATDLRGAMAGHIVGVGTLTGMYGRK